MCPVLVLGVGNSDVSETVLLPAETSQSVKETDIEEGDYNTAFYLLVPQIFIEGLLCGRHCSEHWKCTDELIRAPALLKLTFQWRKINKYVCTVCRMVINTLKKGQMLGHRIRSSRGGTIVILK